MGCKPGPGGLGEAQRRVGPEDGCHLSGHRSGGLGIDALIDQAPFQIVEALPVAGGQDLPDPWRIGLVHPG